jgi:hypothetical protein
MTVPGSVRINIISRFLATTTKAKCVCPRMLGGKTAPFALVVSGQTRDQPDRW